MNWEARIIIERLNTSGGSIAELLTLLHKLSPAHQNGADALWCFKINPQTRVSQFQNLTQTEFQQQFGIKSIFPIQRALINDKVQYGFDSEVEGSKIWFELDPAAGHVTNVFKEHLVYFSLIGWTSHFN